MLSFKVWEFIPARADKVGRVNFVAELRESMEKSVRKPHPPEREEEQAKCNKEEQAERNKEEER